MRHLHRQLTFDVTIAIDPASYTLTETGDDVGYAFRFEEERERLLSMAESALADVPNATVDAVDAHPGYLRGRVNVGTVRPPPAPADVGSALASVARRWNEEHARPTADGNGYLDGLILGDRFTQALLPTGGTSPEEWIAENCEHPEADAAPDPSDGPIFVIEEGDPDPDTWDLSWERYQPITVVVPVLPETWDPVETPDKYDDTVTAFGWAEEDRAQLREYVEDRGRWGGTFRLTVAPHYLRVDTLSRSTRNAPTQVLLPELERVIDRFNLKAPVVAEGPGGRLLHRPELQLGDTAYIGATDAEGRADVWITERGLGDVSGTPTEPVPEPAPDGGEADTDDGGSKGAVDTVFEKMSKQAGRRITRRKTRPGWEG